jgi:hypothetical protein
METLVYLSALYMNLFQLIIRTNKGSVDACCSGSYVGSTVFYNVKFERLHLCGSFSCKMNYLCGRKANTDRVTHGVYGI